ncbi:hypothetical protein AN219_37705 [Streptomyces nanshensis]|nr:hypothetical protein AN219_37705 [Streptomyces nanshensis]
MYTRFLAATITSVGLVQHAQFQRVRYRWIMRDKAIDKLEDHQFAVSVELMQAYADLQLVANPQPLAVADRVMADLDLLFRSAGERETERDAALDRLGASQAKFTQAARHDLWYSPRWWQFWRGGLWKAVYRKVVPPKPPQLGGGPPRRSPTP